MDGKTLIKSDRLIAGAMLQVDPDALDAEKNVDTVPQPVPGMKILYDDDDCVSAWDQIAGGVQSLVAFGSVTDIDRKKLIETDSGKPSYATCIKRAANYTLVCPTDTIRVIGCNSKTYKNACYAERDGIYNYSTENGVVTK